MDNDFPNSNSVNSYNLQGYISNNKNNNYLDEDNFNDYNNHHISDEVHEEQDDYNDNNDNNNIDKDDENSKIITNLVTLIHEKNKCIEELNALIKANDNSHEEENLIFENKLNDHKLKIQKLEEKNKSILSGDHYEIIDFYETQINTINQEFANFQSLIKLNLEHLYSSISTNKFNENFKTTMNNLIKENTKQKEELNKLKHIDRSNKIYKNILFRLGSKIETSNKQFDDFKDKKEEYENYIKELENENEELKKINQKLSTSTNKISKELNKVEKIGSEIENIKLSLNKQDPNIKSNRDRKISNNIISNVIVDNTQISRNSRKSENPKGSIISMSISAEDNGAASDKNSNFINIINSTNQMRSINTKLLDKVNKVDPTAKMLFKKGLTEIEENIHLIDTQIKYVVNKGKVFCELDELLYKLLNNIVSKYQISKQIKSWQEFEDEMKKTQLIISDKYRKSI